MEMKKKEKERERKRIWAANHREYLRSYYREWYRKNGRERADDYRNVIEEWIKKNPKAYKARLEVRKALRRGLLKKPVKCEQCGRKTRVSAHHSDYRRKIKVIWVCSSCHKLIHNSA